MEWDDAVPVEQWPRQGKDMAMHESDANKQLWEYLAVPLAEEANNIDRITGWLNEQGKDGWELVTVYVVGEGLVGIFKRPVRVGSNEES